MSGQLDKFASGSHSAKNAAGLTRKDIINKTFSNMRDRFDFPGTKTQLTVQINTTAGKCLGTRTLDIKGTILHLPVYEKGTIKSAEYAIAYVAGWKGVPQVDEWDDLRDGMMFLTTENKLTGAEIQAWGAYRQKMSDIKAEWAMSDLPSGAPGLSAEQLKSLKEDAQVYAMQFKALNDKARREAKSPAEARKAEQQLLGSFQKQLKEFLKKKAADGLLG